MLMTQKGSPNLAGHRVARSPAPAAAPEGGRWQRMGVGFALYLAAGLYLVYVVHAYAGDALSRVANAYYVLFSAQPHLGAIGFVWNPLPSILALPLVALHPWFPAVVTRGLAGVVVSAAFGAVGVNLMFEATGQLGLPRSWRWLSTAAYALNPLIVLYGGNGMTDLMLATCVLGSVNGLLRYLNAQALPALVKASLWLVVGFGIRYEAIPTAFALAAGLAAGLWGRVAARQIEAAVLVLLAPLAWAAGVWLYFNGIIMKNPLYFLDSDYGNLAQIATGAYNTPAVAAARHSVVGTLSYLAHFALLFWPLLPGLALAAVFCLGRWRDPRAPVLIAGAAGAVALEAAFLYLGHLGEWDRYFLSNIATGSLLAAFAAAKAHARWGGRWMRRLLAALFALGLASADLGTVVLLRTPGWGYNDGQWLTEAAAGKNLHDSSMFNPFAGLGPLLNYVDSHPHLTILADSFIDWPVLVRAANLRQFVITSDYHFKAITDNPRGRVEAMLVPQPAGVAQLDAINRAWPGLWAGRLPWASLIRAFPGGPEFRLYRVGPGAP